MAGFGFKKRETAVALKQLLRPGQATADSLVLRATEGFILRTPSNGIPARVGDHLGSAMCPVFYIDDADNIQPFLNSSGAQWTLKVRNLAFDRIAGDTEIQAKTVFGKLVADFEPCDEDSSSEDDYESEYGY